MRSKTRIMGVLNVTPDSFSDGGLFLDKRSALDHAYRMAASGADIIDVGGESTRPGADDVSVDEELGRVIPVIKDLAGKIDVSISIDTRKARVAEEAVKAGAAIINDVSGLRYDKAMGLVAAKYGVKLILMHMKGTPRNMQVSPVYGNLIKEVMDSLKESMAIARRAGVEEDKVIIDPGIGFGKTVEHNLEILNRLNEFKILSRPICVGVSRKSFIGKVLGKTGVRNKLIGTLAACVIAITKGADILRVHDVDEVIEAARMTDSVLIEKVM